LVLTGGWVAGCGIQSEAGSSFWSKEHLHLARLLRLGIWPESYIYPKEERPIRDRLRKRQKTVYLRATDYFALLRMLVQNTICHMPLTQMKKIKMHHLEEYFFILLVSATAPWNWRE
jgi:hypothetical protein